MTKKNNYSYDIKLRAVMLRFQGKKYQEIQNILKIKHHKQIITWKKWYQAGQIYRFQTPIGYKYINNFLNYFFNEENEKIKLIKKNIKTQLAKNKKNYKLLYLKIIDKYKTKISLNKLLKWLNFNKSSYYRALNNINHPKPLTIVEKIIYQICYQNPIHPLLKNKLIFGYRKVHQLLKQQGYYLNPKTVLNKMRKLNLLCQTKKNTVKVKKKLKFIMYLTLKQNQIY
ncbi:IS3 family transposase [Candidatus Phytoplasma prunorum]|uniref:IS3 family transposase n=1 Tax=Candidatus Phytoplasma prunorum TaxID=47565 RepID=UPI002FF1F576